MVADKFTEVNKLTCKCKNLKMFSYILMDSLLDSVVYRKACNCCICKNNFLVIDNFNVHVLYTLDCKNVDT